MKMNEPKNRQRTLKTTPSGESRPPRYRKTQHNKHYALDEKRSLRTNNHPKGSKRAKHLERNCNTSKPGEVKLCIANKTVSNARKENLIESYNIAIQSLGLTWNKPFYQRQDKKRRAPKEELVQFIINHVNFPLNLKLKMSRDLGERLLILSK